MDLSHNRRETLLVSWPPAPGQAAIALGFRPEAEIDSPGRQAGHHFGRRGHGLGYTLKKLVGVGGYYFARWRFRRELSNPVGCAAIPTATIRGALTMAEILETTPISDDFNRWLKSEQQKTQAAIKRADDAEQRMKELDRSATHHAAQNKLLAEQKAKDDARISSLQQRVDYLTSAIRLYVESTLSISKNLENGIVNGYAPPAKAAAVKLDAMEQDLREITSKVNLKKTAP